MSTENEVKDLNAMSPSALPETNGPRGVIDPATLSNESLAYAISTVHDELNSERAEAYRSEAAKRLRAAVGSDTLATEEKDARIEELEDRLRAKPTSRDLNVALDRVTELERENRELRERNVAEKARLEIAHVQNGQTLTELAGTREALERCEKALRELIAGVAGVNSSEDAISIDEGATDEQQDEVISAYHYQLHTLELAREYFTSNPTPRKETPELARQIAKEFCVHTKQADSTEERLVEIIIAALTHTTPSPEKP